MASIIARSRGSRPRRAQRLAAARPLTLGQASRVPGVRRADAALLMVALLRRGGSSA